MKTLSSLSKFPCRLPGHVATSTHHGHRHCGQPTWFQAVFPPALANSRSAEKTCMSVGPRLAVQRGWKCALKTNNVPAHRVGPEFARISNSAELGHGLKHWRRPHCFFWGFILGEQSVAGLAVEGKGSATGLNYSTENGSFGEWVG